MQRDLKNAWFLHAQPKTDKVSICVILVLEESGWVYLIVPCERNMLHKNDPQWRPPQTRQTILASFFWGPTLCSILWAIETYVVWPFALGQQQPLQRQPAFKGPAKFDQSLQTLPGDGRAWGRGASCETQLLQISVKHRGTVKLYT